MTDLFGAWVPTRWIVEVLDACLAAPQHNYLFLTKNPQRYLELDKVALLPRRDNFWYGTTATEEGQTYFFSDQHKTFVSVEPMTGPLHPGEDGLLTDWVIVGAETGPRKDKVIPERAWVEDLLDACRGEGVPLFMKGNLAGAWGEIWSRSCRRNCGGDNDYSFRYSHSLHRRPGGVLVVFDSWNDRLWKENRALRKELERVKRADGEWQGTADGYADGELVFNEWACSECGYEIETDDPDELPAFCPSCGGKWTVRRSEAMDKWTILLIAWMVAGVVSACVRWVDSEKAQKTAVRNL